MLKKLKFSARSLTKTCKTVCEKLCKMLGKFKRSARNLTDVRGLVLTAMLLALHAVLGGLKIPVFSPDNRITLTFAASAAAGIILGPFSAAFVGGAGDVLGYLINPGGGAYFPGFTVSAMLGGFIYGLFLYGIKLGGDKRKDALKALILIMAASAVITFFINIVLNTYWLSVMYGKAYTVFSAARIIKNLVVYPLHIIIIFAVFMLAERTGVRKKYL